MGVQSLWQLLEPVGRRVNIEAIANKKLAVGVCHVPSVQIVRFCCLWLPVQMA